MRITLDTIKKRYDNGEPLEYVFFYGHFPKPTITQTCLSQWFHRPFQVGENTFPNMEKYIMFRKASLFEDFEIADAILQTDDPKEVKALGRKVTGFDDPTWDLYKHGYCYEGNLFKFLKNEDLAAYLLSTGDKILVEASPYDKIWGIGMKKDEPGIENPHNWKGENLLGCTLMEVREQIKED